MAPTTSFAPFAERLAALVGEIRSDFDGMSIIGRMIGVVICVVFYALIYICEELDARAEAEARLRRAADTEASTPDILGGCPDSVSVGSGGSSVTSVTPRRVGSPACAELEGVVESLLGDLAREDAGGEPGVSLRDGAGLGSGTVPSGLRGVGWVRSRPGLGRGSGEGRGWLKTTGFWNTLSCALFVTIT